MNYRKLYYQSCSLGRDAAYLGYIYSFGTGALSICAGDYLRSIDQDLDGNTLALKGISLIVLSFIGQNCNETQQRALREKITQLDDIVEDLNNISL